MPREQREQLNPFELRAFCARVDELNKQAEQTKRKGGNGSGRH